MLKVSLRLALIMVRNWKSLHPNSSLCTYCHPFLLPRAIGKFSESNSFSCWTKTTKLSNDDSIICVWHVFLSSLTSCENALEVMPHPSMVRATNSHLTPFNSQWPWGLSPSVQCMDPVVTIVCCLSRDDPFVTPPSPDQRRRALDCKLRLSRDCLSDHLSLLKAYLLWEQSSKESHKRLVTGCGWEYCDVQCDAE